MLNLIATNSLTYISIKDSTATGGAVFNADCNSTNVSGNTGWIFASCGQILRWMYDFDNSDILSAA